MVRIPATTSDPAGEARSQGTGLNVGVTSAMGGPLQTTPMQVLAPNVTLESVADGHTEWMIDTHSFNHDGAGGLGIRGRIEASDYIGPLTFRENLSAVPTDGRTAQQIIQAHHDNLFQSPSHRAATFDENQSEIGIGIRNGQVETLTGSVNTIVVGARNTDPFVTGVAYTDTDNNNFYGIGEGTSGVTLSTGGETATTAAAGGYALSAADDMAEVTVSMGRAELGSLTVDMTNGNVKVDIIEQVNGDYEYGLSGDAIMGDGIDNAFLQGAGNLDLTGNAAANSLTGNRGNNVINGGDGADRIVGGNGSDRLFGGEVGDRLYGGNGRDVLFGGDGYDHLSGGNYHDRLYGEAGNDRMFGGDGNDRMYGGNGHDRLYGNDGSDQMNGGNGRDVVVGGDGNDRLIGANSHDRLYGSNGHDRLYGNNGNDRLIGGNGNDLLNGGANDDTMTGGNGADRFVFSGGHDTITDFTDDVDTILIGNAVADGSSAAALIASADVVSGDTIITFLNGDTLTIEGLTDTSLLGNDFTVL